MKILRCVIFTAVCFLFISFIYPTISNLFYWIYDLRINGILKLILLFFSVSILGTLVYLLTTLIFKISPYHKYAFYVAVIFCLYFLGNEFLKLYFLDVSFEGKILSMIIVTIAIKIFLTIMVIIPAYAIKKSEEI